MYNDITTLDHVLLLLKAGINPKSCNLMFHKGLVERNEKELNQFPLSTYTTQEDYIKRTQIYPLWTTGALLDTIPDSKKQSITLTRGGYQSQCLINKVENLYIPDAYFASYNYFDKDRNLNIRRVFGSDSYIDAVTKLVVNYLEDIRQQIG